MQIHRLPVETSELSRAAPVVFGKPAFLYYNPLSHLNVKYKLFYELNSLFGRRRRPLAITFQFLYPLAYLDSSVRLLSIQLRRLNGAYHFILALMHHHFFLKQGMDRLLPVERNRQAFPLNFQVDDICVVDNMAFSDTMIQATFA